MGVFNLIKTVDPQNSYLWNDEIFRQLHLKVGFISGGYNTKQLAVLCCYHSKKKLSRMNGYTRAHNVNVVVFILCRRVPKRIIITNPSSLLTVLHKDCSATMNSVQAKINIQAAATTAYYLSSISCYQLSISNQRGHTFFHPTKQWKI